MKVAEKKKRTTGRKAEKRISLEKFLQWSEWQEDAYKYEWTDGVVEKTKKIIAQRMLRYTLEKMCVRPTRQYLVLG